MFLCRTKPLAMSVAPLSIDTTALLLLQGAIELSDGRVYHIKAYVFPSGRIIVDIPCSTNPFPLWLQDRARTSKDFLLLLSESTSSSARKWETAATK